MCVIEMDLRELSVWNLHHKITNVGRWAACNCSKFLSCFDILDKSFSPSLQKIHSNEKFDECFRFGLDSSGETNSLFDSFSFFLINLSYFDLYVFEHEWWYLAFFSSKVFKKDSESGNEDTHWRLGGISRFFESSINVLESCVRPDSVPRKLAGP